MINQGAEASRVSGASSSLGTPATDNVYGLALRPARRWCVAAAAMSGFGRPLRVEAQLAERPHVRGRGYGVAFWPGF
jgi:hypothetical protein